MQFFQKSYILTGKQDFNGKTKTQFEGNNIGGKGAVGLLRNNNFFWEKLLSNYKASKSNSLFSFFSKDNATKLNCPRGSRQDKTLEDIVC